MPMDGNRTELGLLSESDKYIIFSSLHIVDSGFCSAVPTLCEAQWGVKGMREGLVTTKGELTTKLEDSCSFKLGWHLPRPPIW